MVMNWVAIITLALAGSTQGLVSEDEAYEVMVRLQELLHSETSIASYSMRVVTPDWQRTIHFDSWDDRPGKRAFIRILSPKKDKGTAYLKDGGSLWMYLPNLERNIRVPPSMMLSSWMGSSFTYDDLIMAGSVAEDYTHAVVAGDQELITIESTPKPEAPIVWGKLVHVVTREGIPVSEEFYDENGKKQRELKFEDVREMDGRQIPTRWVMRQFDDSGKWTVLQIESVQFDSEIAGSVFTHANMKRGGR